MRKPEPITCVERCENAAARLSAERSAYMGRGRRGQLPCPRAEVYRQADPDQIPRAITLMAQRARCDCHPDMTMGELELYEFDPTYRLLAEHSHTYILFRRTFASFEAGQVRRVESGAVLAAYTHGRAISVYDRVAAGPVQVPTDVIVPVPATYGVMLFADDEGNDWLLSADPSGVFDVYAGDQKIGEFDSPIVASIVAHSQVQRQFPVVTHGTIVGPDERYSFAYRSMSEVEFETMTKRLRDEGHRDGERIPCDRASEFLFPVETVAVGYPPAWLTPDQMSKARAAYRAGVEAGIAARNRTRSLEPRQKEVLL